MLFNNLSNMSHKFDDIHVFLINGRKNMSFIKFEDRYMSCKIKRHISTRVFFR